MPQNPSNWLRGLSYGPILGETSRATNYGPSGNALGTYDVAASPNILAHHPLGTTFNYGGNTYTLADTSYNSPGNPTQNTLEFRDTVNNQSINPADIQWNSRQGEWYPSEGGLLGKIGSHMPGASTYLAGQSVFDFIRGALGKMFGGAPGQQQGGNIPSWVGNMLSGNNAPGSNAAAYDPYAPRTPANNVAPGFNPPPPSMPPQPYGYHLPGGGVDPGYVDPRSANQFIAGLIDWNGPGAANMMDPEALFGGQGNALRARLGMMGRGGARSGKMPAGQA